MAIIDDVKKKSLQLRKEKDVNSATLLYVISSAQASAKQRTKDGVTPDVTDDDIVSVLKKEILKDNENITLLKKSKADSNDIVKGIEDRITILSSFLPAQVGQQEILNELDNLFSYSDKSIKQMGKAMNHLKTTFGINLDTAQASRIVKEYLST